MTNVIVLIPFICLLADCSSPENISSSFHYALDLVVNSFHSTYIDFIYFNQNILQLMLMSVQLMIPNKMFLPLCVKQFLASQ